MKRKDDSIFLIVISIIYELLVYFLFPKNNDFSIMVVSLISLVPLIILLLMYKKTRDKRYLFYIIYFLGLLFRTIYIMKTDIYTRQHDVDTIYGKGHLKYIYTIYKTGKLPTTNEWQLYHPPLWHIIGAIWLKIASLLKVDILYAYEGIQTWSLISSALIIIIADKICNKIKIDTKGTLLVDLLLAVHPTLIILSGSINNDCLLMLLQALIILWLIKYYLDENYKNIIGLALVTGLAVMTKMNGAIMAIPILYVFIKKMIEKSKNNNWGNFYYHISLFLLISIPIGLWFQFRNLIMFGSITIPGPSESLYVGNIPLLKRLFTLNPSTIFQYVDLKNDYNLNLLIIKTSIFGEFTYKNIKLLSAFIFVTNVYLIAFTLFYIIKYMFIKKKNMIINILLITWITSMVMMLLFNIKYPYKCSMNFRYIAVCLIPGIIIPCYMILKGKSSSIKIAMMLLAMLFIIEEIAFIYLI